MQAGELRRVRSATRGPFPDQDTGLTPELRGRIASLAEQIDAHRKRVLSPQRGMPGADLLATGLMRPPASPAAAGGVSPNAIGVVTPNATGELQPGKSLTLTALYNVLQALRAGRALSVKEKAIHTQGLVSVLKDLHDELDAAVLQAYGLSSDPGSDALLTHLVALNTLRAAEERTGRIRWLRPEFQHPQTPASTKELSNQELPAPVSIGLQADLALNMAVDAVSGKTTNTLPPWPGTLPEQVRAVAQILASAPAALPLSEIEARFKGKGPWKKGLPRILETLEALGRARQVSTDATVRWRP